MASSKHLKILNKGVSAWNAWRKAHPGGQPNLRKANLRDRDFRGANFNDTNLRRSSLEGANLDNATFRRADLRRADLTKATMRGADLSLACLVDTRMDEVTLDDCRVYGVSAWNVRLKGAVQRRLIVTRANSPVIEVDDLEVAQFVHLLIKNRKISQVMNTMGQRAVLILGRFSPPERKHVLDSVAEELRRMGYLPMMFDFERPDGSDLTETIQVLAGLALFVIADITSPKSAPLELQAIVPQFKVPVVSIAAQGETPFSMYQGIEAYPWVLKDVRVYPNQETLIRLLDKAVVAPALEMDAKLRQQKAQQVAAKSIEEIARELAPARPDPGPSE